MSTIPEWLQNHRLARMARRTWSRQTAIPVNDVAMPPLESSREWHDIDHHWKVTRDVAFNRHSMNDGEHVSPTDNGQVHVGADNIEVRLVQGIDEEAFRKTLSMATRATIGLDLNNLPDETRDWEEMMKGGLQTALETQVIIFAVSGVSRTCTHQLVRTRKASFHQQSQRASYMGDQPEVRMPESIWVNQKARAAWLEALSASQKAYRVACEEDISYQDARFGLLEGTTNFIMLEYPIREFLNVFAYRACSMFQWEIVAVMRQCGEALIEAHPWIEPYVKITCEKTSGALDGGGDKHHCTFAGWESPEGQCDFPWARDSNRSFQPVFHQIKRRPADASDASQS